MHETTVIPEGYIHQSVLKGRGWWKGLIKRNLRPYVFSDGNPDQNVSSFWYPESVVEQVEISIERLARRTGRYPGCATYDEEGFDQFGWGRDGFNRDGFDFDGFGRDGFDQKGFDRDGFDQNGFTQKGFDRDGFDRDGFDRDGFDPNGIDRDGFDRRGYDSEGFDRGGLKPERDPDGRLVPNPYGGLLELDRDGFDRDGFDRNGFDRDGKEEPLWRVPLSVIESVTRKILDGRLPQGVEVKVYDEGHLEVVLERAQRCCRCGQSVGTPRGPVSWVEEGGYEVFNNYQHGCGAWNSPVWVSLPRRGTTSDAIRRIDGLVSRRPPRGSVVPTSFRVAP